MGKDSMPQMHLLALYYSSDSDHGSWGTSEHWDARIRLRRKDYPSSCAYKMMETGRRWTWPVPNITYGLFLLFSLLLSHQVSEGSPSPQHMYASHRLISPPKTHTHTHTHIDTHTRMHAHTHYYLPEDSSILFWCWFWGGCIWSFLSAVEAPSQHEVSP